MPLTKPLLVVFFVFNIFTVFAQQGWIAGEMVLKDGSTKEGIIKIKLVSKDLVALGDDDVVKFKPSKKGRKKKYHQGEIDHIVLQGYGHYEYVKVSENKFDLFRVVETGKAILYHRNVTMSSSSGNANGGVMMTSSYFVDEYYVLRDGETIASPLITGRISKSFRHRAAKYFSDCPKLVAKIENKTFRKKDIQLVVKEYNRCESLE